MNEVMFAVILISVVIVFGMAFPLYLVSSWVYQDAKQFEPINDWLTPKIWVLIVIFSNYMGLIIYLFVRKTFTQKQAQCQTCGYLNQNEANFCNRCGEPLDWPIQPANKVKTSYKKLVLSGISLLIALLVFVGSMVYVVVSGDSLPFGYTSGITFVSNEKGGVLQGYLSHDFSKISSYKKVFYFTTTEIPHLDYELKAEEGEIGLEVFDKEGKKVFKSSSPAKGSVSDDLLPDADYQVIIKSELARKGRFAFDWR